MMTFKERLLENMREAIEEGVGIEVFITNPNTPKPEYIMNPTENLPYKVAYYDKAYDDELRHNHDKTIKIEAFRKVELGKIETDLDL